MKCKNNDNHILLPWLNITNSDLIVNYDIKGLHYADHLKAQELRAKKFAVPKFAICKKGHK